MVVIVIIIVAAVVVVVLICMMASVTGVQLPVEITNKFNDVTLDLSLGAVSVCTLSVCTLSTVCTVCTVSVPETEYC